jgi:hypothetical protein
LFVVIFLALLYTFTVPLATQWILLPAEWALSYMVIEVGRRRSNARLKQAREHIVDFMPAQSTLPQ